MMNQNPIKIILGLIASFLYILILSFVFYQNIKLEENIMKIEPKNKSQEKISLIIQKESSLSKPNADVISSDIRKASKKYSIDESLLLAIISVESRFDQMAYNQGAIGLMQIVSSIHSSKVIDKELLYHSTTNIYVGSYILKDCIRRTKTLEDALSLYNGSYGDEEYIYANKILRKREVYRKLLHNVV